MKVYHRILQDWKVLKCDFRFWNVLEIYDIKLIVMERFSYDLEMKMCEQKKTTNQQKQSDLIGLSNGHKLSWLLVGQANDWVKKLHARELSRNQSILRFGVILHHDWQTEQCLVLHNFRVFFGGKTKSPCFDLFVHLLIKQNNKGHAKIAVIVQNNHLH